MKWTMKWTWKIWESMNWKMATLKKFEIKLWIEYEFMYEMTMKWLWNTMKWLWNDYEMTMKLFFILFHTFSYFFILFHTLYKTEKVWRNMKKYELRISSKKIIESFHTSIHIDPRTHICATVLFIVSDLKIHFILFRTYFFILILKLFHTSIHTFS